MATVAQVAKASLQRILVQASEADLEPDEYQDYIFALNNWMLALEAEGVSLGFTEVSGLGDVLTVPTGTLRGIIANMAVEVAPDYGGIVTPALQQAAIDGLRVMRLIGQSVPTSNYPCTLPVGSGNYDSFGDAHFYSDDESAILAETTGTIALESAT